MRCPYPTKAPRPPKRRQAVSGYWHTQRTLARWCRVRSYLDSAAAHGITALDAITTALAANPWLPTRPQTKAPARACSKARAEPSAEGGDADRGLQADGELAVAGGDNAVALEGIDAAFGPGTEGGSRRQIIHLSILVRATRARTGKETCRRWGRVGRR